MSRVARQVVPHAPHYIVQRGNRNQDVFFGEEDYRTYLSLLREQAADGDMRIHAYCLLPNQVHLVVTPRAETLRMVGEANRRYAAQINRKMGWTGHLWAGRFASQPMDEQGAYDAVAALEVAPVRAGVCAQPAQYRWSSARQRVREGSHNLYVARSEFLNVADWESYWQEALQRNTAVSPMMMRRESAKQPLGLVLA